MMDTWGSITWFYLRDIIMVHQVNILHIIYLRENNVEINERVDS